MARRLNPVSVPVTNSCPSDPDFNLTSRLSLHPVLSCHNLPGFSIAWIDAMIQVISPSQSDLKPFLIPASRRFIHVAHACRVSEVPRRVVLLPKYARSSSQLEHIFLCVPYSFQSRTGTYVLVTGKKISQFRTPPPLSIPGFLPSHRSITCITHGQVGQITENICGVLAGCKALQTCAAAPV